MQPLVIRQAVQKCTILSRWLQYIAASFCAGTEGDETGAVDCIVVYKVWVLFVYLGEMNYQCDNSGEWGMR